MALNAERRPQPRAKQRGRREDRQKELVSQLTLRQKATGVGDPQPKWPLLRSSPPASGDFHRVEQFPVEVELRRARKEIWPHPG